VGRQPGPPDPAGADGLAALADRVGLPGPLTPARTARRADGGVGVLIGLLADDGAPGATRALLAEWLPGLRAGFRCGGLFDSGLAGYVVGLTHAARAEPKLAGPAAGMRTRLAGWTRSAPWRTDRVGWSDYDLVTGASGVLLAQAGLPDVTPAELAPAVGHLVGLCDAADLPRLRIGGLPVGGGRSSRGDHLDHGLAHGIPGILVALAAAVRRLGHEPAVVVALQRVATVLARSSYVDAAGVTSWPAGSAGADPAGTVRRQAWCYGTPGVAWALWDAGTAIGDPRIAELGWHAMATVCDVWLDERYLYGDGPGDRLGVCHGAAGVLAVADAFARHAGHPSAARLSDHLAALLDRHTDAIGELAGTDLTMLTGVSGVLSVLHTVRGGRRDWLPILGLR